MRTEQGRWYSVTTGKCILMMPKAKKRKGDPDELRKTTLRDAFDKSGTMLMVPSVTTINSVKAKPGLLNWLINQAIVAAATCPRVPGMSDADWLKNVLSDADEERDTAAATGKDFHSAADTYWAYGTLTHEDPAIVAFLTALHAWRQTMEALGWGRWSSEQPYLDKLHEFAGTPDLTATKPDGSLLVVDYKTTDLSKYRDPYDEWAMQIAAGLETLAPGHTHRQQSGVEIIIDRNTGDVLIHAWSEAEIARGLRMFRACNDLWKEVNRWQERKQRKGV